jgi:hypothetical protein
MSSDLEKFIRKNRGDFDDVDPSTKFGRILSGLFLKKKKLNVLQ